MFDKIMRFFVEFVFWMAVFLPITFAFAFIALVVYLKYESLYFPVVIAGAGVVFGIFIAEKIRRKYGSSNFMGVLRSSPDFDNFPKKDQAKELPKEESKK